MTLAVLPEGFFRADFDAIVLLLAGRRLRAEAQLLDAELVARDFLKVGTMLRPMLLSYQPFPPVSLSLESNCRVCYFHRSFVNVFDFAAPFWFASN
jgi:hypothetical protein